METGSILAIIGGAWVAILVIMLALLTGWIMNIIKLVDMPRTVPIQDVNGVHQPLPAMFILRIAGIFVAPLGGVIGYLKN